MQRFNGFLHRIKGVGGNQWLSSLAFLGSADGDGLDLAIRLYGRDDGDEFICGGEKFAILWRSPGSVFLNSTWLEGS